LPTPAPLRIPEFRNLWLGQTVSQLGDALYGLVFVFMANRVTGGRSDIVGLVAAATALPFLLFGPAAGVAADRYDRRRLMLGADLASAAILLAFVGYLVAPGQPSVVVIGAAGFLLSSVNSFFLPARAAAVPRLVPAETLQPALALSNATMSLMHSVGIGLAALLLGPLERADPDTFFLYAVVGNMATFLVSAVFIARLPGIEPDRGEGPAARPAAEMVAGARFLASDPLLRVAFPVSLVVNLAVAGFFVVYLKTNDEWFGGAFSTISWIEFSFLSSMVVGSVLAGKVRPARPGLAFSLAMAAVGVAVAGMAFARELWAYVALNVACGLALPFGTIPLMTYIGTSVPDAYRGRVSAVSSMVSAGVQPLGMAATGLALQSLGLVRLYLAMGGTMALAALAGLAERRYRRATIAATTEDQASKVRSDA
jgi:predicted MFS family arabinose efflux permease